MDSTEGGIVLTEGAESSLQSEVKEKQDQDPILLDLKESVHKQRVLDFEQGGDGKSTKEDHVYLRWMDSKRGSRRRLIAPDIPFIQVPPRCNII